MSTRSLRLRLLIAAAIAIAIALSLSGAVLARLFLQHVEAREYTELGNHQNQIIGAIQIDASGHLNLATAPADPRFFTPNGGLYWQIDMANGTQHRSRSLWDSVLVLPPDNVKDGSPHRHIIAGPNHSTLMAIERGLVIGPDGAPVPVHVTVAVDRHELDQAVAGFRNVLMVSLGVLGLTLLSALFVQVAVGLRPLKHLSTALQRVHSGSAARVAGQFPSEIQPLVMNMNALLDREQRNNQRARERAADLAHGFKTPLAILATVSRDLLRDGQPRAAVEIESQINIMGQHVRHELARARTLGAVAIGQAPVRVRPIVDRIVIALKRISADRALTWHIDVDRDVVFVGDENDLLELIGNLADNAAKWAKSEVSLSVTQDGPRLALTVDDDGPGIPKGSAGDVLMRGRRLDETTDGNGLGLSIVTKIVEAYDGTIVLGVSALGGLSVIVALPSRPNPATQSRA